MKKLQNCVVENCIPTPSSCTEWNGGDITYLGICNGESLNNIVWEIVNKLQNIAGEDISSFDLDELLTICNKKAPLEVNLISILTLLRDNQICIKDYIDTLTETVANLSNSQSVNVNLKCYAQLDNLGNSLSITRESLDQLVIDKLCSHETRITSTEGKLVVMQEQIDTLFIPQDAPEKFISTCIQTTASAISIQVITIADAVCDDREILGTAGISSALAKTGPGLNAEFGGITGWNPTPSDFAENYGNLLLEIQNLRERINYMEDNCCAPSCDDVKVGFLAIANEDYTGVILRFTSGAGTSIPVGFTDAGSMVTITDAAGVTMTVPITITQGGEEEVITGGLSLSGEISIDITVKMSSGSIQCEKCISQTLTVSSTGFCVITASAPVTITYKTCVTF